MASTIANAIAGAASSVAGAAESAKVHSVGNAKIRQLQGVSVDGDSTTPLTTYFGTKMETTDVSLRAGNRGPTMLNDFHAREKISKFDHERIPERVVHARGAAAHGHFTLHTPIPELTKAGILTDTSRTTPIFLRFSTVSGSRGSADSVRDVRGFALRFYTEEGNWDIVGNNIPIFFIQDAIQFPDLVHALKPEPHNEIPQAQTAHDNAWDWMGLSDVSAAMHMWILSDRTIPRSFRMMPGHGIHTFRLVNEEGKSTFVKFHFIPQLGTHSLVWDEALKLAGQDPDFHRRDLHDAIEAGAYPKWDLGIQTVAEEDEHKFDFDLLDSTKIIPEDLVPIKLIGTFELNKNTDNYFAETEQVAFCTQHIVPGIDFSNDPLLAGRNFSYFDTQISRLGVNFGDLPINQPVCPMRTNNRDGQHQHRIEKNRTPYYPNRNNALPPTPAAKGGFSHYPTRVEGIEERAHGPKFTEYFSQATLFYNSLTDIEKHHLIDAAKFELSHCDETVVQQNMINRFNRIDRDLAVAVIEGLSNCTLPDEIYPNHGKKSEYLSQITGKTQVFTATGRKVGIYLLPGFDYEAVFAMQSALLAAGIIVIVVAPSKGVVKSSAGPTITSAGPTISTNFTFDSCRSTMFDAVAFMGTKADVYEGGKIGRITHALREAYMHQKGVMVEGNAVEWAKTIGLPTEFPATVGTGTAIEQDTGVIFVPKIGLGVEATKAVIDGLAKHRFWERDVSAIAA